MENEKPDDQQSRPISIADIEQSAISTIDLGVSTGAATNLPSRTEDSTGAATNLPSDTEDSTGAATNLLSDTKDYSSASNLQEWAENMAKGILVDANDSLYNRRRESLSGDLEIMSGGRIESKARERDDDALIVGGGRPALIVGGGRPEGSGRLSRRISSIQDIILKNIRSMRRRQKLQTTEGETSIPDSNEPEYTRPTIQEDYISRESGGKIQLHGCSIEFPPRALRRSADIEMTLESLPTSKKFQNSIRISPIIGCDLSHVWLNRGYEIDVEILAYCSAEKDVPITVMSTKPNSDEWVEEQSLVLGKDRRVKFKTKHFSKKYLAFLWITGLGHCLSFPIHPRVYFNDLKLFKLYLCIDDEQLLEKLDKEHKGRFHSAFVMPQTMRSKFGESVTALLQCVQPKEAEFDEDGQYHFEINEIVDHNCKEKDFELKGEPEKEKCIHFKLTLMKGEVTALGPLRCKEKWPVADYGEERQRKRQESGPNIDNSTNIGVAIYGDAKYKTQGQTVNNIRN